MWGLLETVLIVIGAFFLIRYLYAHGCTCGRSHPKYLPLRHMKVAGMAGFMTLWIVSFIWNMVLVFGSPSDKWNWFWMCFAVWAGHQQWMELYYHEKDKWKSILGKLSGRVTFNSHGRLVVTEE